MRDHQRERKSTSKILQGTIPSIDQDLKAEMAKGFVGYVVKLGTLRRILKIEKVQILERMLVNQVVERKALNQIMKYIK